MTECTPAQMEFHGLGRREVIGKFDGGKISSEAGGVLLREVEKRIPIKLSPWYHLKLGVTKPLSLALSEAYDRLVNACKGVFMDWTRMLAYITGSVDQELL